MALRLTLWLYYFLIVEGANFYLNEYICPEKCICFDIFVNCSHQNLTELPTGIHPTVTDLDLSHNKFVHFPTKFTSGTNLTMLNLSYNNIQSIDHEAFKQLGSLESLDFSHNNIRDYKDVVSVAFNDLTNLKYLDFSFNKINGKQAFISIPSLIELKLINCGIMTLKGLVLPLTHLKELYLQYNKIGAITEILTSSTLEYLDLSHAGIKNITETAFKNLNNLKTLILKNNEHLRFLYLQYTSINYLDISGCSLEQLPSGDFSQLEYINLSGNKIRDLKQNYFEKFIIKNKLSLNISFNSIKNIRDVAFQNVSCSSIDLSYNGISSISKNVFNNQRFLTHLNLSHNFLTTIAWNIKKLTYLDASFNEIHNIKYFDFENMTNLVMLKMKRNFISNIPDNLYMPSLILFDISNCRLKSLNNQSFIAMTRLRDLDVSYNQLTSVNPSYFPRITNINIVGNPWRCECAKLKGMFENYFEANLDNLICDSPEKMEGKSWRAACFQQWYPTQAKQQDNLWYYSVGAILIMMVILLIYIGKKRRNKEIQERLQEEEEERRRRLRETQALLASRITLREREPMVNAPDPRESQRPPSYHEAISLPKLDASHPSLASLNSRENLNLSTSDLSKKNRVKRKRRRRRSEGYEQRMSQASCDTDSEEPRVSQRDQPLESDF